MHKHRIALETTSGRWIIDRRIPIAVILAILTQMAGMLIWAASLETRMQHVEIQTSATNDYGEKLARIEERVNNVKQDTEMIKRQLGYLASRLIGK